MKLIFLKKATHWATVIIAACAVFTLLFSICTSSKTSKTLKDVSNSLSALNYNLSAFIQPVIHLDNYSWKRGGNQELVDCEHAPLGITITYKNISNIPIKVIKGKLLLVVRSSNINDSLIINKKDILFVPSGENFSYDTIFTLKMRGSMIEINQRKLPDIYLTYVAIISSIDELRKYQVELEHKMQIDCDTYDKLVFLDINSSINPIDN